MASLKYFIGKNIYAVLSVVFLSFSLIGSLYLVKLNADIRNRATTCKCYPQDETVCQGTWFHPDCNLSLTCEGTKNCPDEPKPTAAYNPNLPDCPTTFGTNDHCTPGSSACQENSNGKNTGYKCKCVNLSTATCKRSVWNCTTYDPKGCPGSDGSNLPGLLRDSCGDSSNRYYFTDSSRRCVERLTLSGVQKLKKGIPLTDADKESFAAARFTCPNDFDTQKTPSGCADNREDLYGKKACLVSNFCGNQQIDMEGSGCTLSASDRNCLTPEAPTSKISTKVPSKTPSATKTLTPTKTISPSPTKTLTATKTPTATHTPTGTQKPTHTPTSTNTPTNTIKPSLTPTLTLQPTHTPTLQPTPLIAQGPSPTRIILPESGFDFPLQALTITGIIVTLLGFLILL